MTEIRNAFVLFVVLLIAAPSVLCAEAEKEKAETRIGEATEAPPFPQQRSETTSVEPSESPFGEAAKSIQKQLEESVAELNRLRQQAAEEKIPLSRKLSELESKLSEVRLEYQETTRKLDSRTLDLTNLRSEIKSREEEATYLSNLLGEYVRNFESRLHIAELQRYRESLEAAKLAPENSNLSEQEVYEAQAGLLGVSLERLHDALGGTRFEGTAVDSNGLVKQGTFVLIGPSAIFRSEGGEEIGTAEQRLGSLEPTIIPFKNPADVNAAAQVIATESAGRFPFDPTLGNAHKIEETEETFLEHVQKGGPVMYPIFGLAGAALLVALYKWLAMLFIRKPSQKRIRELLTAVARHDRREAKQKANAIGGPVGKMLQAGAEHLNEPVELIEEVMYEKVLSTRLKLERFLPFIAISAASAPLLGLLGTVTGIINTFKLITVFGSGDVKTLSGGISEALITTEFGLIVAIPSLLLHAFLSRKARGVINQMEKAAVTFVNQVGKTQYRHTDPTDVAAKLNPPETENRLPRSDSWTEKGSGEATDRYTDFSASNLMDRHTIRVSENATVADALHKVRTAELEEENNAVFIVDEQGRYQGYVLVHHLLNNSEQTCIESLARKDSQFVVRVDTHEDEIKDLFSKHDLVCMPVIDRDGQLVGRVKRNGNGKGKTER